MSRMITNLSVNLHKNKTFNFGNPLYPPLKKHVPPLFVFLKYLVVHSAVLSGADVVSGSFAMQMHHTY